MQLIVCVYEQESKSNKWETQKRKVTPLLLMASTTSPAGTGSAGLERLVSGQSLGSGRWCKVWLLSVLVNCIICQHLYWMCALLSPVCLLR